MEIEEYNNCKYEEGNCVQFARAQRCAFSNYAYLQRSQVALHDTEWKNYCS